MPPLTPEQIGEAANRVTRLTMSFEDDILRDISRRIAKAGTVTDTAEWQIMRLKEMGMATDFIEQRVARYTLQSEGTIRQMFFETAQMNDEFYREVYAKRGVPFTPWQDNDYMKQLLTAGIEQTSGKMKNLTASMGFVGRDNDGNPVLSPVTQTYRQVMDRTQLQVATGATDYVTAIRQATQALAASGLRYVDYASGARNHCDVAVRRACLTGVNQLTAKIALHNMEELHTDLVEVTAHAGARSDGIGYENHASWQGKWYRYKPRDKAEQQEQKPRRNAEHRQSTADYNR